MMNALIRRGVSFLGLCLCLFATQVQTAEASSAYHCDYDIELTSLAKLDCNKKEDRCKAQIVAKILAKKGGRGPFCRFRKPGDKLKATIRTTIKHRALLKKGAALNVTYYTIYPTPRRGVKIRVIRYWKLNGPAKKAPKKK